MNTYIALLRGINVGGHKKTPMAELRSLLEKKGFKDVKTYIQSGNVIFKSSMEDTSEIEDLIKKSILDYFEFEVPILVRTNVEIQSILDDCPFTEDEKIKSYFSLLKSIPNQHLIEEVQHIKYPNEKFEITPNCIYFYSSTGYGKAKYSNNFFEKKLKVSMTARNYRTMMKLLEMSTT